MTVDRAALVPRTHGLITAASAQAAGITARDIRRLIRSGAWIAVRRGVYADAATWEAADPFVGRARLRNRAAHLTLAHEHVFSHDSAAVELGLPLVGAPSAHVHTTRPGLNGSRLAYGIKQHGAHLPQEYVVTAGDLPVTDAARTAVDLGREHGYAAGLVACDAALRRGVTRSELDQVARGMRNWPGTTAARGAITDADPGAETAGETLARILVRELQVGTPMTQFPLLLRDGRTVWLDLLIGSHAVEFDGRVKYRNLAVGGLAGVPAEQVVWEEKRREQLVRGEGLGVSRLIWMDVDGPGRAAALARLRAEVALTFERHGPATPPHLLAYAERMRATRARRLADRRTGDYRADRDASRWS